MITLIDYGTGNVPSVAKALQTVGASVLVTHEASDVREASTVVLPGVGAFEDGLEMGRHAGMGVLSGQVVRFPEWLAAKGLKVPHTGWNQVELRQPSALLQGLTPPTWAYFNHAYYCGATGEDTVAASEHGIGFPCVVQRGNVLGVQFHPEKSQDVGLRILRNLLEGQR